jgi:hypothetical protein
MTDAAPEPAIAIKRCPRCGRSFDCGARTRPFACWCLAMPGPPLTVPPQGGARCLCPECLADEIARRVSAGRG